MVVRNCSASNYHGANLLYIEGNSGGIATHCVISNCTATGSNQGTKHILFVGAGGRLENSLICDNYSSGTGNDDCAALINVGEGAIIRNNTFVNNNIKNRGLLNIATSAQLVNNVFANNTYLAAGETPEGDYGAGCVGFNYGGFADTSYVNCAFDETCAFTEVPNDTCVLGTAETFFAKVVAADDESGETSDFTPLCGGLLYNAGTNYDGMAELDLAGQTRLANVIVDIGAFESLIVPPTVIIIQ